jgi:hypothetical protein
MHGTLPWCGDQPSTIESRLAIVYRLLRRRAPDCVFNHAMKGIENEDVLVRLAELERSADETKPG